MSQIEQPRFLSTLLNDIGQPTQLKQNDRAGIAAIWGDREQGAFTVFRGPIDETYEVSLVPSLSSRHKYEQHNLTADGLNRWVNQNAALIKSVLAGE